MKLKPNLSGYCMICLLILVSSCSLFDKEDENSGNTKLSSIEIGSTVEVATSTIPSTGGSIKVAKPDTPVDGMEITIPPNSFPTSQIFKVSYSEIKSHEFGQYFNPISPMITIACDGGYSSEIMSITIPVEVPEGQIAIGFFLDEATGKLEGIPFESITSNSITLLTRHFLSGNKLKSGNMTLKSASAETNKGANIIISSISESILNSQPIIASGYKPGVDDWEFVNYGSYIAPGGQCAGQNMAAMWYYFEKKPTDGNLFNKFSDNANLWQDNARGYRFCSVIHNDLDWNGTVSGLFDKYIDKNQEMDKLKLYTIAGTMLVTGEPQGIGIYMVNGAKPDGTPIYGGHDLICYQVSVSGGKLYISDPNKPGIEQSIDFKNNKFDPYIAKLNGNAASNPYPFVTYYAKTAYIEWDKIGKRYAELLDNTIGTKAPNTFPAYTLWVKDGAGSELKDGIGSNKDTLRINAICPTAELSYDILNQKLIGIEVLDQNGVIINKGTEYAPYVKLKPGANKLGFYIYGWRENNKYSNGDDIPKFIDFKWITVNYSSLIIDPNPLQGEPSKEYKFTAKSKGSAPKSSKYIWDFGDGTSQVTIQNDSTITHTFTKEGTFNVKVELYDNTTNKKVIEASSVAQITKVDQNLAKLQKTKYLSLAGTFNFVLSDGSDYGQATQFYNNDVVIWNNTNFSVSYKNEGTFDAIGFKSNYYSTVSGTVSADTKTILTVTYDYKADYYRYNAWFESHTRKMTITNIPLIRAIGDVEWGSGDVSKDFYYMLDNSQSLSHVTAAEWRWWDKDGANDIKDLNRIKDFWEPIEVKFREVK